MKCIPFNNDLTPEGVLWREDMNQYAKYINSHSWQTGIDGNFFHQKCIRCNAILLNPTGTISGHIGCSLIKERTK